METLRGSPIIKIETALKEKNLQIPGLQVLPRFLRVLNDLKNDTETFICSAVRFSSGNSLSEIAVAPAVTVVGISFSAAPNTCILLL